MRPRDLSEVLGQERWLSEGAPLRRAVDEGQLPGGGVTPQDVSALLEEIERSLETRSGISPTLRWE